MLNTLAAPISTVQPSCHEPLIMESSIQLRIFLQTISSLCLTFVLSFLSFIIVSTL
jgi:hypothetical protein